MCSHIALHQWTGSVLCFGRDFYMEDLFETFQRG